MENIIFKTNKSQYLTVYHQKIFNFITIPFFSTFNQSKLHEFLQKYLNNQFRIIDENDGYINNFNGEELEVIFGLNSKNHEQDAVNTAILCSEEFNRNYKSYFRDIINLELHIGINSGKISLLHFYDKKNNYNTIIGNEVNIAYILKNSNWYYKSRIIISDAVKNKLDNNFIIRNLDNICIKGIKKSLQLFEIIGFKHKVNKDTVNCIKKYNEGFKHYKKKEWEKTIEILNSGLKFLPNDGPSKLLIERCETFIKNLPPITLCFNCLHCMQPGYRVYMFG